MDITIHILMLIIIGIFFLIDKYSPTNNAMFVVILLTFFGFIFMFGDPTIEIVDYYSANSTIIGSTIIATNDKIDISNQGLGIFDVQSFIVLMYMFFMIVAITNLFYENKKYGK